MLNIQSRKSFFGVVLDEMVRARFITEAEREIAQLQEWMAQKDHETGVYYVRRRAFDSAIIYFQDVVANYPNTPRARDAYLRLAEAFSAIRYREDAREVCTTLRAKYHRAR